MKRNLLIALLFCTPLLAHQKALIFGITGQDGSYLTELLLDKGYEVHGVIRRSSSINTKRIDAMYDHPRLFLHYGDLTDGANIMQLISSIMPDEIYNLAAQSHVQVSFQLPEYTGSVDALGTLRILEGIRRANLNHTRFYQASSSEMYGLVQSRPQNENTPFYPRSPYGVAKLYAHWITKNYREAYGMFACSGLLFNHESPRRGETFVTRKITRAVSAIFTGTQKTLRLGNLNAERDWGHAKDYVEAIWMMLQAEQPEDFVIASGETHSVREFVELAFHHVGIPISWKGEDIDEIGYNNATGTPLVMIDRRYFRPAEVDYLCGDATLARNKLKWTPKHTFKELVTDMMESDLREAKLLAPSKCDAESFDTAAAGF